MTEAGPLTVDDRLDIMDLAARYAWAMDGGMPDGYADVFVPDAVALFGRAAAATVRPGGGTRFAGESSAVLRPDRIDAATTLR